MSKKLQGKPRVLMIGVLGPPIGGMVISLTNLIRSDLKEKYDISVLDVTGYRARKTGI